MEAQGWQGFWEQFSMTKGIKINLFYWKEEIVQLKCWWWWRESNKCKGKFKEGEQSKQTKQIGRNLAGRQCESAWSACGCRGILVKLVMHQISVDKIENPCYWINRCTFDMVLPSILSTQYWESLIFSPCIVIGEIEHFCVPRGQRRFFIKIEAKASICSWEVCFCCCTH